MSVNVPVVAVAHRESVLRRASATPAILLVFTRNFICSQVAVNGSLVELVCLDIVIDRFGQLACGPFQAMFSDALPQ